MTDILDRLKWIADLAGADGRTVIAQACTDAITEIEQLRKAAEPFADFYDLCERNGYGPVTLWAFPEGKLPFGQGSIGSAAGYEALRNSRHAIGSPA